MLHENEDRRNLVGEHVRVGRGGQPLTWGVGNSLIITILDSRINLLKAKSNEIFDLQFFHYLNQPGPVTNR